MREFTNELPQQHRQTAEQPQQQQQHPDTPHPTTTSTSYTRTTQLLINQQDDQNVPYGDLITTPKTSETFRVYYQNIRGIKPNQAWDNWNHGNEQLQTWQVDAALLVETNIAWTYDNKQRTIQQAKRHFNHYQANMTASIEPTSSDYQPGGVLASIHNNWTGHTVEHITDPSGLGRWAGFRLEGKKGKQLILLAVYRPNKSATLSDNTCYSQQWRILRQRYPTTDPNPRKQLLNDLKQQITLWRNANTDILIGMDANESTDHPKSELANFLQDTQLTSISTTTVPPATYDRGSKCIDFLIGTANMVTGIQAMGYLPFYAGAWHSDHRALFMDIDVKALFNNNTTPLANPSTRHLASSNKSQTRIFFKNLNKNRTWQTIETDLHTLSTTTTWEPHHYETLEQCDIRFTAALLDAERKCARRYETPWSPPLHTAHLIKTYWRKRVTSQKTRKVVQHQLEHLLQQLQDPEAVWQGNPNRPAKYQLSKAIKTLQDIRRTATERRKDFLIQQHTDKVNLGQTAKAKIIAAIRRAEQKRHCFAVIKAFNKPRGHSGGLSHILVQTGTELTRIQDRTELEDKLYHRNRIHFAQAKNTPCVQGPLAELLGYNGISSTSKTILANTQTSDVIKSLPTTVQAILSELKQTRPTLSSHLPFEKMIAGLHKWREATTTSPSGKHLGIYKTLTKAYLKGQDGVPPRPPNQPRQPPNRFHLAHTALRIQHLLINLAIEHTHTYERWRTIHNFFLEKIQGKPLIDKLRVIHLYEADWNLLLKYFIAYKLNITACRQGTTSTEQAGGRPGRNAGDTAAATIIANEIILLQRLAGAILYNDAKACFDRIIENISNLSLMAEGLHEAIALLHAQTLKVAKYYIKTKYGIGDKPNGHLQPDHFLGTGQGAADSMPRWGILSDKVIKAYNKLSRSQPILSPFDEKQLLEKIKAYVDDTNCRMLEPTNSIQQITELLKHNAKQWESLLFTIGGKLELSKCKFSTFHWQTDDNGTMVLSPECKIQTIDIIDSETNQTCTLQEIPPSNSYKLLGVHIALDGNTTTQENAMTEKCVHMAKVFSAAPLTTKDVKMGYTTVVLPTIKYGLAATAINWKTLDQIQQPLTHALLPKMGINRHMPRAVVHAPEHLGGFGIQQLSAEQGIAHINFLLGSLRAKTVDYKTILILLESYIVTSGITGNPLANMMAVEYVDARWLETTRIFLNAINASIEIPALHTINPIRQRDKGIMETACKYTSITKILQMINNCRLFLRIHTLAEITILDSNHIHPAAYSGAIDHQNEPIFWHYSKSSLRWPRQNRPPEQAWRQWQKFLRTLLKADRRTWRRNLGPVTDLWPKHRQWHEQSQHPPNNIPPHIQQAPTTYTWTDRTFNRLYAATTLDLIITTTSSYEDRAFSWTIAADSSLIMSGQAKIPEQVFVGTIRSTLAGILHATDTMYKEYHKRNAPMNKATLNIWTKCGKTIRICRRYKHQFHTAATAIKCEDEIIRHTIRQLGKVPSYQWHKINPTNPEHIIQLTSETIIPQDQLQTITNIYTPPAPSASLILNKQVITSNTTELMRIAYSSQSYRVYLQDKHSWSDKTIESIEWQILEHAMNRLNKTQQHTIKQFIHGWLPTNAHPGQNKPTHNQICPGCTAPGGNQHTLYLVPHGHKPMEANDGGTNIKTYNTNHGKYCTIYYNSH